MTTETIHEVARSRYWPETLENPGESWFLCTCGEELDSQGGAGGAEWTVGDLFQQHLEDVGADA